MNHQLQILFTNFINTQVITQEDADGNEVKGIFIPFIENEIKYTKYSKLYANFYIIQKKDNMYFGQTHYLKSKWSKGHMAYMKNLGFKYPPIIGGVKPCWDKNINKMTESWANEKKGVVKIAKDEEDE